MESNSRRSTSPCEPARPQHRPPSPPPNGVDNRAYQHDENDNANHNHNHQNVSNNSFASEKREQNGDTKTLEAVNLELINLAPKNGNTQKQMISKKEVEVDMNNSNPYDEYFVPVNEHRKYMRGEKLYVTADKRTDKGACKRPLCWTILGLIVAAIVVLIVLAATGVLFSNSATPLDPYNSTITSARALGGVGVVHDAVNHNTQTSTTAHDHNNTHANDPYDKNNHSKHEHNNDSEHDHSNHDHRIHSEHDHSTHSEQEHRSRNGMDLNADDHDEFNTKTSEGEEPQGDQEHIIMDMNDIFDSRMYIPRALEGEFKIDNELYQPEFEDPDSEVYKEFNSILSMAIRKALFDRNTLERGDNNIHVEIVNIRNGSVIVTYRVQWKPKDADDAYDNEPITIETLTSKLSNYLATNDRMLSVYHVAEGKLVARPVFNLCLVNKNDCEYDCEFDETTLDFKCTCPSGLMVDMDNFKKCVNIFENEKLSDQDYKVLSVGPYHTIDEFSNAEVVTSSTGNVFDWKDINHEYETPAEDNPDLKDSHIFGNPTSVAEPSPEPTPEPNNNDSSHDIQGDVKLEVKHIYDPGFTATPEPTTEPTPKSEPPSELEPASEPAPNPVAEPEPASKPEPESEPKPTTITNYVKSLQQSLEITTEPEPNPEPISEVESKPEPTNKVEPIIERQPKRNLTSNTIMEINLNLSKPEYPILTEKYESNGLQSTIRTLIDRKENIDLNLNSEVVPQSEPEPSIQPEPSSQPEPTSEPQLDPELKAILSLGSKYTSIPEPTAEPTIPNSEFENKPTRKPEPTSEPEPASEPKQISEIYSLENMDTLHGTLEKDVIIKNENENEENYSNFGYHDIVFSNNMPTENKTTVTTTSNIGKFHSSTEQNIELDTKTSVIGLHSSKNNVSKTISKIPINIYSKTMNSKEDITFDQIVDNTNHSTSTFEEATTIEPSGFVVNEFDEPQSKNKFTVDELKINENEEITNNSNMSKIEEIINNNNISKSDEKIMNINNNNMSRIEEITNNNNNMSKMEGRNLKIILMFDETLETTTQITEGMSTQMGIESSTTKTENLNILNGKNMGILAHENQNTATQTSTDIITSVNADNEYIEYYTTPNSTENISDERVDDDKETIIQSSTDNMTTDENVDFEDKIRQHSTETNVYITTDKNVASRSMNIKNNNDSLRDVNTRDTTTESNIGETTTEVESDWLSEPVYEQAVDLTKPIEEKITTQTTLIQNTKHPMLENRKDDIDLENLNNFDSNDKVTDNPIYGMGQDYNNNEARVKRVNTDSKETKTSEIPINNPSIETTTINEYIYKASQNKIKDIPGAIISNESTNLKTNLHQESTSISQSSTEVMTVDTELTNNNNKQLQTSIQASRLNEEAFTTYNSLLEESMNTNDEFLTMSKVNNTHINNLNVTIYEISSHNLNNTAIEPKTNAKAQSTEFLDQETEMNPFLPEIENNKNLVKKLQEGHDLDPTNANETQNENEEHQVSFITNRQVQNGSLQQQLVNSEKLGITPIIESTNQNISIINKDKLSVAAGSSNETMSPLNKTNINIKDKPFTEESVPIGTDTIVSTFLIDTADLKPSEDHTTKKIHTLESNLEIPSAIPDVNDEDSDDYLNVVPIKLDKKNGDVNGAYKKSYKSIKKDISDYPEKSDKRTLASSKLSSVINNEA